MDGNRKCSKSLVASCWWLESQLACVPCYCCPCLSQTWESWSEPTLVVKWQPGKDEKVRWKTLPAVGDWCQAKSKITFRASSKSSWALSIPYFSAYHSQALGTWTPEWRPNQTICKEKNLIGKVVSAWNLYTTFWKPGWTAHPANLQLKWIQARTSQWNCLQGTLLIAWNWISSQAQWKLITSSQALLKLIWLKTRQSGRRCWNCLQWLHNLLKPLNLISFQVQLKLIWVETRDEEFLYENTNNAATNDKTTDDDNSQPLEDQHLANLLPSLNWRVFKRRMWRTQLKVLNAILRMIPTMKSTPIIISKKIPQRKESQRCLSHNWTASTGNVWLALGGWSLGARVGKWLWLKEELWWHKELHFLLGAQWTGSGGLVGCWWVVDKRIVWDRRTLRLFGVQKGQMVHTAGLETVVGFLEKTILPNGKFVFPAQAGGSFG